MTQGSVDKVSFTLGVKTRGGEKGDFVRQGLLPPGDVDTNIFLIFIQKVSLCRVTCYFNCGLDRSVSFYLIYHGRLNNDLIRNFCALCHANPLL